MKKIRNDIITVLALIVLALAALVVFRMGKTQGDSVVITIQGKEAFSLPLSQNIERVIESEKGQNILVIENGKAHIKSATCPDGICVNHRAVSRIGETIVCLPNELVVRVVGSGNELDITA